MAGRSIGPENPSYIIAEAGVNHNGDVELARRLIDAAAEAGADAVKFQTFSADKLVMPEAPKAEYQKRSTEQDGSQLEMLRALELSQEDHRALLEHACERGITFLSTPFDEDSADFLHALGVCAFKIGSGDLTNLPLLEHVAGLGKPMIVSTGMATLGEVEQGVETIRRGGCDQLALLHCVSNYPAQASDANLRAMQTLAKAFGVPVGWSDHMRDDDVVVAAVALGACLVEKHFTLDCTLPGPDHKASLEPNELARMVQRVRHIEQALGDGRKRPAASETEMRNIARRSLVLVRAVPSGQELTRADLGVKRPGTGLSPVLLPHVLGRRLRHDAPAGTILTLEMLV